MPRFPLRQTSLYKDRLLGVGVLLGVLLALGSSLWAQSLADISHDFSPLSALVISQKGETVLLDKGRVAGVHEGDIFTIYKRTQKVVHPVTKEVLGYMKRPVAWVEVNKVEEAFCQTRILLQKEPFQPGAPASRFTDIKALLIGKDPATLEELYLYLSVNLPEIKLVKKPELDFDQLTPAYLAKKGFLLVFFQKADVLYVYDPNLVILKFYDISPLEVGATKAPLKVGPKPLSPYPYSTTAFQRPLVAKFRKVGQLSKVLVDFEMGDLDGDGRPEIVYMTPQTLWVAKYKAPGVWRYPYKGFGKILNFSLGPNGYIALNIFKDKEGFCSRLLHFSPQGIKTVQKDINLLLGFFDTNGDGIKETLWGQSYDPANFFGHSVYHLILTPQGVKNKRRVIVPPSFRLLGAALVDIDGDGELEIITQNLGHKLEVYKGQKKIWTSTQKVGGSLYTIQATQKGTNLLPKITVTAEVDPWVKKSPVQKRPVVLIVSNRSVHHDIIPGIPVYSGGQVLALTYTPMGYSLLPISAPFDGPVQGISSYKQEIFVAVVKGNPFTQKGESFLLAFPFLWPRP